MTLEIIKASEMIAGGSYHPKFMLIGDSGGGKTNSLTTFPPSWQVLVLDFFGNKESLEGASNVDIISYSELDVKSIDTWPLILKEQRELIQMLDKNEFRWDAICLDTITGLIRFAEFFLLRQHPEKLGIGGAPAQHHYRGLSHIVGEFIMGFLGYPITVVICAHAEMNEDDPGLTYRAIMAGKKWRNTIYSYVGEVYHAFGEPDPEKEDATQYMWETQPSSRWPMLKSVMNQGGEYWGRFVKPDFWELLYRRNVVDEVPPAWEGKERKNARSKNARS